MGLRDQGNYEGWGDDSSQVDSERKFALTGDEGMQGHLAVLNAWMQKHYNIKYTQTKPRR